MSATGDSQNSAVIAPTSIVVRQMPSVGNRLAMSIGWLGFVVCGIIALTLMQAKQSYFDTTAGITESFHSGNANAPQKIAILSLTGLIANGEGFVKQQIDRIRADNDIKAIVLRVNSPGGTVTASDYMYHHLTKLMKEQKLPLVVSMGSIATSGGYYVSMAVGDQEDSIFAEPTSTTGSIGVIIPHYDLTGLLAKYDVKDDSIASHPRKQMLSPTRPIEAEERLLLQAYVDETFERFKMIVKSGRPVFRQQEEALTELATGEVFTAATAQRLGLVDKIGFIEDAIDRAAELANLQSGQWYAVRYSPPTLSLKNLAGLAESQSDYQNLRTLFELSTPQAYYLSTSIPPLLSHREGKFIAN